MGMKPGNGGSGLETVLYIFPVYVIVDQTS